jgi:hypothetical protein
MGAHGGTPQASLSLSDVGNAADFNSDGVVDEEDLLRLASAWLTEKVLLAEDVDRDGSVNSPDFAALAQNWLARVE